MTMVHQMRVKSDFLKHIVMLYFERTESQLYIGHTIMKLPQILTELWHFKPLVENKLKGE